MARALFHPAVYLAALACAWAMLLAAGEEAQPQVPTESCLNCKHQRCLESLATQREALINAYESLAGSPAIAVRDDSGKALDEINTDTMPRAEVEPRLAEIHSKGLVYEQAVERMTSRVPQTECGPPVSETVAAETHLITCDIPGDKLNAAMAAMPCKELADMIYAHEHAHHDWCMKRKHTNGEFLPYIFLTPAGVAKEEAKAYRAELAKIRQMLDKLKQPRITGESLSVLHLPMPMGTIRMTVTGTWTLHVSEGSPAHVTGEGEHDIVYDMSGSSCSIIGGQGIVKSTVAGQVSGGVLKLSVTTMEPSTTQIFIKCPQGFGFSQPVPKNPSTIRMPYQDGASVESEPVKTPQATVKTTLTLHLKCKKPE